MERQYLAQLANSNINILSINSRYVSFEYQWRKANGAPKWSKGALEIGENESLIDLFDRMIETVRELRAELEA